VEAVVAAKARMAEEHPKFRWVALIFSARPPPAHSIAKYFAL
jgi:hypothetical protein